MPPAGIAAQSTFISKTSALTRQWPLRRDLTGSAAGSEKDRQWRVMAACRHFMLSMVGSVMGRMAAILHYKKLTGPSPTRSAQPRRAAAEARFASLAAVPGFTSSK